MDGIIGIVIDRYGLSSVARSNLDKIASLSGPNSNGTRAALDFVKKGNVVFTLFGIDINAALRLQIASQAHPIDTVAATNAKGINFNCGLRCRLNGTEASLIFFRILPCRGIRVAVEKIDVVI